ncbi:helix-hairpin-helix domain-containing protein, partial [Bacillus mycoides]
MRQNIDLDASNKDSVRRFLEIVLTQKQADALCEAFENPIAVIEEKDVQRLCQANGIGLKTAKRIIDLYESQKDYSEAYIELGKYELTPKTIRKITDYYGSPELAIQKVKENPYLLMEIDGFGFKKCDKMFLQLGGDV